VLLREVHDAAGLSRGAARRAAGRGSADEIRSIVSSQETNYRPPRSSQLRTPGATTRSNNTVSPVSSAFHHAWTAARMAGFSSRGVVANGVVVTFGGTTLRAAVARCESSDFPSMPAQQSDRGETRACGHPR
jgi:hypothetical protein